jgi:flavin reductase (DIM6/NTAB) family NADH-FMN oxidoreductase RutF
MSSTTNNNTTDNNNTTPYIIIQNPNLQSRILYPNPVCLLTTSPSPDSSQHQYDNVMILSWLTPVDNHGSFMFSINKSRFTTTRLVGGTSTKFCLSIPTKGMESLLLQIGSCSGFKLNKFTELEIKQKNLIQDWPPVIDHCAAYLACRVHGIFPSPQDDHFMISATIIYAKVLESYWQDGKTFSPTISSSNNVNENPPILTFLGSQTFGYVNR